MNRARGRAGSTPLVMAARYGMEGTVRELLDNGANPSPTRAAGTHSGRPPARALEWLANDECEPLVETLVAESAASD